MSTPLLSEGRPWPLGAHCDSTGVNFALFSAHATRVDLCIFDKGTITSFTLQACTDQVWHAHLAGAKAGLSYAYRVYGSNDAGNRFDSNHLLLDPYARELSGTFSYERTPHSVHGLLSSVVDEAFDWGNDQPPAIPLEKSILYELHVKGATQSHPDVPQKLRGTYAGLASAPMLAYFKKLGITAINLLPVHGFIDELRLVNHKLCNYWGYNTLAFFAPETRYAARINGQSVISEFRQMVRTLHQAHIEVILDVVYNHTAETDEFGPTLSFRGIDNASYYRLLPENPAAYLNFSGCGNTFNLSHPRVLQLVMDSLRYWVKEMHVDGFRFDLAAALSRDSAFLDAVRQDPVLSRVKLIAEPWDLGMDGYRLGRFLPGWSEWNDRFRDDVRAFWLTGEKGIGALAQRLAGSSEIFNKNGRSPLAGVNFITAHDGFTLRDLVSYRYKHNEANGENNRDGHNDNLSTNCDVEGPSDDATVLRCRTQLQKALLATLFFAQGVPMLQGGDELGRTQEGNNNAYCQDNALTWIDWANLDAELLTFTQNLIALRQRFPQLALRQWLSGEMQRDGLRDITWWHPEGREMHGGDWQHTPALGFLLAPVPESTTPECVLVLINRDASPLHVTLPSGDWQHLCNTHAPASFTSAKIKSTLLVPERSVQLLVQKTALHAN